MGIDIADKALEIAQGKARRAGLANIAFEEQDGHRPKFEDGAFDVLLRPTLIYMSSVVLVELYAGARDRLTLQRLNRVYRTFDKLERLIAPNKQVWFQAAQVLQQFGARRGFEAKGLARLTHDILIAM